MTDQRDFAGRTPAELVAAEFPCSDEQIRAWLDERNIPVFVGVQALFSEVRTMATRAAEDAYQLGRKDCPPALSTTRERNAWSGL
jgi:hypothetical protein